MSSVSVEINIKAPVETVWKTIMDPARFSDWVTIHKSVEDVSSPPDRHGAQMTQYLTIRGVSFKVKWALTEVDAPSVATWEGKGPARSQARTHYELRDDGKGGTDFAYTNEFKTPGGPLGAVASKVIVGGVSEREARHSLERLKALLEPSGS